MKKIHNPIKVAIITAIALILAPIIAGIFGLYSTDKKADQLMTASVNANDSSKVSLTNSQNEIKGDFVNGDKKVENKSNSKINAPKALIATQNQSGDNTLNITQISDSYATRSNDNYIKEITYPKSGEYGHNILDKNTTQYSKGAYSMNALIPKNQNLIVEISGATHDWGFPVFQSIPGWRTFDSKVKGDTITRKFRTVKFGTVDLEFYLLGGKIKLAIFENDSNTVTWRKTLIVKK